MKFRILLFAMIALLQLKCKKGEVPAANEVFIDNMVFTPASITVKPGTTITWINKEGLTHTVTSDTLGVFDSGNMLKDKSFSFTFNTAGKFPYHCTLHPGMKGNVIVQ
jgi:plastocyanin